MPSAVSSSTSFKQENVQSQDSQQEESTVDADDNARQQDKNKGTVDTDMLLNNHVEDKETAEIEDSQNTKESKSMPDQAPPEESELEPSASAQEISGQETDQDVSDSIVKQENEDKVGAEENKSGDLDIESMLAAIHNDNPPPDSSEPQNSV